MENPRDPGSAQPTPEKPGRSVPPRRGGRARARRGPRSAYSRFAGRRISVGEILGGAFSMYARNFVLFTGIAVVVSSPIIAIRLGKFVTIPRWVSWALDTFLLQIITAAIIYGVFRRINNKKAGFGRCLSISMERLFPLLGVAILSGIASFLPQIPGYIMMMTVNIFFGSMLILVGVVFSWMIYVALATAPAIVVVERIGVLDSLRRSLKLTRGSRWTIFFVYVLISILGSVIMIIWIFLFAVDLTWAGDYEHLSLAAGTGLVVISIVFTALTAVAVALTFYKLKIKVEGIGEEELASVFD